MNVFYSAIVGTGSITCNGHIGIGLRLHIYGVDISREYRANILGHEEQREVVLDMTNTTRSANMYMYIYSITSLSLMGYVCPDISTAMSKSMAVLSAGPSGFGVIR